MYFKNMIILVVFLFFDLKKGNFVIKDLGCIVFYLMYFLIVCICIGGYFVLNYIFFFIKKVFGINRIRGNFDLFV